MLARIMRIELLVRAALVLVLCLLPRLAIAVSEIHYVMGTYLAVRIDDADEGDARAIMRRCFTEARRLDAIFSRFDVHSELTRVNQTAAHGIDVSSDFVELLRRSLSLSHASGGRFDVTIGARTRQWRETQQLLAPLSTAADHANAEQRARLSGRRLVLADGVELDFDGVAKGYAVDRCVAIFRRAGVERAFINFGESSQFALGRPRGERAWTVLLRDLNGTRAVARIALRDQALSVSSVFGHSRQIAGERIGHIVDPRDGGIAREPAAVAVIATSATSAEAWSKALLLGTEVRFGRSELQPIAAVRVTAAGIEKRGPAAVEILNPSVPLAEEGLPQ